MTVLHWFDEFRSSPSTGALFSRLVEWGGRILRAARAAAGRRVVADLARLDDHMLADIGLTRSDLRDAAAQPLTADPTDVLLRRANERRAAHARSPLDAAGRRRKSVPYY